MQKYNASNLLKIEIGRQGDLAINSASGNASSATTYVSSGEFEIQVQQEPKKYEDAQGNRSSTFTIQFEQEQIPWSLTKCTDVEMLARFIYHATGEVTSAQDGSTGAYEHEFRPLNNVLLPAFTLFYNVGAEDYKRATYCYINSIKFNTDGSFSVSGFALEEDDTRNVSSTVSPSTITTIAYQSNGLTRYTFGGAPDLSTVKNGDVLVVPTDIVGVTNSSNKGDFIVVTANNTTKYVDVINKDRTDATDDETGLTAAGSSIEVLHTPAYTRPAIILSKNHSAVRTAPTEGGLAAATAEGLSNFEFELVNNLSYIWERAKSKKPSAIIAKNLGVNASLTQLSTTNTAERAQTVRENSGEISAWQLELEETSIDLGTSNTYHPLLKVILPEVLPTNTRTNMRGNDERAYDWVLNVVDEQGIKIVMRNETASYS